MIQYKNIKIFCFFYGYTSTIAIRLKKKKEKEDVKQKKTLENHWNFQHLCSGSGAPNRFNGHSPSVWNENGKKWESEREKKLKLYPVIVERSFFHLLRYYCLARTKKFFFCWKKTRILLEYIYIVKFIDSINKACGCERIIITIMMMKFCRKFFPKFFFLLLLLLLMLWK